MKCTANTIIAKHVHLQSFPCTKNTYSTDLEDRSREHSAEATAGRLASKKVGLQCVVEAPWPTGVPEIAGVEPCGAPCRCFEYEGP